MNNKKSEQISPDCSSFALNFLVLNRYFSVYPLFNKNAKMMNHLLTRCLKNIILINKFAIYERLACFCITNLENQSEKTIKIPINDFVCNAVHRRTTLNIREVKKQPSTKILVSDKNRSFHRINGE